jgi:hypothetical protein
MRYLHVKWTHSSANDPVELYSEVDDEDWEIRKVEVFRDGTIGYASASESTPSTVLAESRVPSLEEIAADFQFLPRPISKDQFEKVWNHRLSSAKSA